MGRETLYVANITQDVTEETLKELFEPFGDISEITFVHNERFNVPAAHVTMSAEKAATKANQQLNGVEVNGLRLAVSYPDLDADVIERGLSKKARQTAEGICKTLGEDIRKPVRRIHTMVLLCGHAFVNAILEEAIELYNGEGMLTLDGSRKRSAGGVFFRLTLPRMAPPIYQIVHPRGGKLPDYKREDDRAIYHLIKNPHNFDEEYYNQVNAQS
jgi:RNA recognition motif-containing protein